MKRVLIVGGANGIGLSMAKVLTARDEIERVYIVDKTLLADKYKDNKTKNYLFDLNSSDYSFFDQFSDPILMSMLLLPFVSLSVFTTSFYIVTISIVESW